jgi:glycyl-tRNA synthetase beta chain
MVGEFPELQGVMGSYYAAADGLHPEVVAAIKEHYLPKGLGDTVPSAPVSMAVALADKIEQLVSFFNAGEIPTGSGDPFALRRAALGVINIIRENRLRLHLLAVIRNAGMIRAREVLDFLAERLRIQLRSEGARHDVLSAVLALGLDDDFTRLLARTSAVAALLGTEDGKNLLAAAKRAANILRIEEKKDGPHDGPIDPALLTHPAEIALAEILDKIAPAVADAIAAEDFSGAMTLLASLRAPLDAFFADVTVNDGDATIRKNRLRLLAKLRAAMNNAADFSKIDG